MILAGTGRMYSPQAAFVDCANNSLTCIEDKAEVSMRGEWAGIAINLRTSTPNIEAIQNGVNKLVEDDQCKKRCLEIQKEHEELACFSQLERYIKRSRLD